MWSFRRVARFITTGSRLYATNTKFSKRCKALNKNVLFPGAVSLAAAIKAENSDRNKKVNLLVAKGQKILKDNGNLNAVEGLYMEALHLALEGEDRKQIAYVQDHLANLMLRQDKLNEAEKLFQSVAQNLVYLGVPKSDPSILEISLKLATIAAHKGDIKLATTCYEYALEESRDNLSNMKKEDLKKKSSDLLNQKALLGMILDSFGRFLFVTKQYKKSLEITQEACNVSVELFGENDPRTIILYNTLSIVNSAVHNNTAALIWAKKCTSQAELCKNQFSDFDLTTFWTNIACIYKRLNETNESNVAFKKALFYAIKSGDKSLQNEVENFIAQENKIENQ